MIFLRFLLREFFCEGKSLAGGGTCFTNRKAYKFHQKGAVETCLVSPQIKLFGGTIPVCNVLFLVELASLSISVVDPFVLDALEYALCGNFFFKSVDLFKK